MTVVDKIVEKVLLRGGKATEWNAKNTLLLAKEIAIETDTYKMKLGDGIRKWRDLPYLSYSQITKVLIDKWNQASVDATTFRNSVAYYITQSDINNWNSLISIETDPIFTTSAAFGITNTDITNWNSNTGTVINIVATQSLSAFIAVTGDGAVGNSSIIGQRNKIVGITKAAIAIGFSGDVINVGKIINPAWTWVIGDRIYLNGTSLSTIAPITGYSQQIGIAIASDTIDIKLIHAILL